jgi:hypothetical protein
MKTHLRSVRRSFRNALHQLLASDLSQRIQPGGAGTLYDRQPVRNISLPLLGTDCPAGQREGASPT